jgi:hypothetical protein
MTVGRKEEKNLKAKQKKLLASQMDKQYSPTAVGKSYAAFFNLCHKNFRNTLT